MTDQTIKSQGALWAAMVERGDFQGALAAIDAEIALDPSGPLLSLLCRERAHYRLYLGDTHEARADFDTTARLAAEQFQTAAGRLQSDVEFNAIGVTYWIEGHRGLALAFWRFTTDMLTKNRVSYSHMGGGIEAGLLLWFGAVHERKTDDVASVQSFYEQRLASRFWSHDLTRWPGPLVRFFLDQIDERELVESASDSQQSACEANFALAIRARERKRYAAYRKHLKLAAPDIGPQCIFDFYNVLPYFLARFEVQQSAR